MIDMSLKYKIVIGSSEDMSEVEDNSVQLVVTSPPYHNLVVFSDGKEEGSKEDLSRAKTQEIFFERIGNVWKECYRVLKRGGYLVCEWEDIPVGSWTYGYPREICLAGPMVKSIEDVGLGLISRWFWRKFATGAALSKFQYTLHGNLTKSDPRAVSNIAYAFAFKKRGGSRPAELDFTREEWTEWCDGMWYIENPSSRAEDLAGGAVFPEELVRRFIKIYSSPGDLVLDCFLGTGTTMKVAFEQDRSCVGYEVLPRMLNTIKKRVEYGRQKVFDKAKWSIVKKGGD